MKYIIEGFKEKNSVRKKLLSFGVTPNTIIEVIRVAPLGDPIEIKVRGYMLSLRKNRIRTINFTKNVLFKRMQIVSKVMM